MPSDLKKSLNFTLASLMPLTKWEFKKLHFLFNSQNMTRKPVRKTAVEGTLQNKGGGNLESPQKGRGDWLSNYMLIA